MKKFIALLTAVIFLSSTNGLYALEPVIPGSVIPEQNSLPVENFESSEQTEFSENSFFNESSTLSAVSSQDLEANQISSPPSSIYANGYNADFREDLPGYGTVVARDSSTFSYRYDLGAGPGAVLEVVLDQGQGFFALSENFEFSLRRQNQNVSFEGINRLNVYLEDINGNRRHQSLTSLSDTYQTYSIDLSGGAFDASRVNNIIFSLEHIDIPKNLVSAYRRGEIFVQIDGLGNRNPISGSSIVEQPADVEVELVSSMSEFVRGQGSIRGYLTPLEPQENTHGFRYDVGGSEGSTVSKNYSVKNADAFKINPLVKLAMKNNGNGANARVRFIDEDGDEALFTLDLTDQMQQFALDLEDPDFTSPFFDASRTSYFQIEIDRTLSPERKGEILYQFIDFGFAEKSITELQPQFVEVRQEEEGPFIAEFMHVPGSEIYQLQVSSDPDFNNVVFEGFPPPYTVGDVTYDSAFGYFNVPEIGTYYLRVRGSESLLVEEGPVTMWSETYSLEVTEIGDTEGYSELMPQIDQVQTQYRTVQVDFSFPADTENKTNLYHIQLASDPDFNNIVRETFPAFGPGFVGAEENGTYYLRVRGAISGSLFEGFVSEWSETRIVNIDTSFPTTGPAITEAAVTPERQLSFSFLTVPGAELYRVQILGGGSQDNIIHEFDTTETSFNLDVSSYVGSYQLRVRASASDPFEQGPLTTWSIWNLADPVPPVFTLQPAGDTDISDTNHFGLTGGENIYTTVLKPDTAQASLAVSRTGFQSHLKNGLEQFSGAGFAFDNFNTGPLETVDISAVSEWIFGVKKNGVGALKMEIIDEDDFKHTLYLNGLEEGEFKYYRLPINGLRGIDLTKIRLVYFVLEGTAGIESTLDVQVAPDFVPGAGLFPDASKTAEDIEFDVENLPEKVFLQALAPGGDASSEISVDEKIFSITYNTGTQGWAGGGFNFDNPDTPEKEVIDFSEVDKIVMGLQGNTPRVKLEVIDSNGARGVLYLNQIESDTQNIYEIEVPLFSQLDLTSIDHIFFIIEGNGLAGTLEFQVTP